MADGPEYIRLVIRSHHDTDNIRKKTLTRQAARFMGWTFSASNA
jgi:hypothetical protein